MIFLAYSWKRHHLSRERQSADYPLRVPEVSAVESAKHSWTNRWWRFERRFQRARSKVVNDVNEPAASSGYARQMAMSGSPGGMDVLPY